MRSLRNITTLLLVGVLLAFGTNRIPVGANIPHITVASLSFAASALEVSDAAPKSRSSRSSRSSNAAQALNDADEALLHCAHCVSPEVLVKVASDCCNAAVSGKSGKSGKCGECPAQQCGGCCGNGYTSLFLSSYAYSITFPSKSLAYSPEDWAATQRAHRPLLEPPRCS